MLKANGSPEPPGSATVRAASAFSVDRPQQAEVRTARWGSDVMCDMLRALGIEFIALTPGASFRGLHDSLVNYLGNARPEMILAIHEECAVAIAHGYARVTGRPMAVALHSNVGLMHATMAIFNAWCDRVPIFMIGAVGPMDAVQRRPWVDWIHTARDLGGLVRGYTKWDDQPASVAATLEAFVRAHQIALTPPQGPVYVCLDAALQEQTIDAPVRLPPLERFGIPTTADPPASAVERVVEALAHAKRPLLLIGRVTSSIDDWTRRVELAERLNARVLTDLKTGATFPTEHPLHPYPPGIFASGDASILIREADVIVSLDWIDLAGALKLACGGEWPTGTIVQCSLEQYIANAWSMDYQALPASDISILAHPDALVRVLLERIPAPAVRASFDKVERPSSGTSAQSLGGGLSVEELARVTTDMLAPHNPSYIRLPLGWPGQYCRFAHPLDYIGFDGAGGIGSGPGMAVGAALALRDTDRLPVAVLGDGDYLMGLTAVWSGVHYQIPVLMIVANNHSFFNDELHQERTARVRDRPIENRWIGVRMGDPPLDLARLAEGQGAVGIGPVDTIEGLEQALASAIAKVKAGATCVIDVQVVPEYARTVSSALLRHIPGEQER